MSLTRHFKETIQARIKRDPAFREALLKEGVECLLSGDVETGKAILRDYINATLGFEALGGLTRQVAQEPDAYVRSERQSASPEPVRDYPLPSGARGLAAHGPVSSPADGILHFLLLIYAGAHGRLLDKSASVHNVADFT